MLRKILLGCAAGLLVSIGGCVYLSCENKYVGAVLFSVALLGICRNGYLLFTGKIGFIPRQHLKADIEDLLFGLLGNVISSAIVGFAVRGAIPVIAEAAELSVTGKLSQTFYSTAVRAFLCGVLMYLAVSIYRSEKSISGIVFCIPTFILAGFEHSIADMFYFAAAGEVSFRGFFFILTVLAGNAVGAVVLSLMSNKIGEKQSEKN